MNALPAQLQKAALKREDDGCLTVEVLKDHLQKWLKRGEIGEALQVNLNELSPADVVHAGRDDVDAVFSPEKKNKKKRGGSW